MPFPNDFSARLAGGFDLDEPHTCTPGAAGCGWTNGDMATFNQDDWGVGAGAAGLLLVANYDAIYASTFAELLNKEVAIFERIKRGDVLPLDEHFDRRLEVLLDEAEKSGDYLTASKEDLDAMEREALELIRKKPKTS